jgi:hypothetical protein
MRRPLSVRLCEKVKPDEASGCWHFSGSKDRLGYGTIGYDGKVIKAHRAAWMIANGPIPPTLHVLHKCDTPSCVNPDHLWLGTHDENMRDKVKKGRQTRAGRPKKLSPEDRAHIQTSSEPGISLAARYGVSQSLISAVRKERTIA